MTELKLQDKVEDLNGQFLGEIVNIFTIGDVERCTVQGNAIGIKNYVVSNIRKVGSFVPVPVVAQPAPQSQPPYIVTTYPNLPQATPLSTPGILNFEGGQLFLLGEHQYILVCKYNAALPSDIFKDAIRALDPEAELLLIYSKTSATFESLTQSDPFRAMVEVMVQDILSEMSQGAGQQPKDKATNARRK